MSADPNLNVPPDLREPLRDYRWLEKFAGCTRRHLQNQVREGKLDCLKIGTSVRFTDDMIRLWLARCRREVPE